MSGRKFITFYGEYTLRNWVRMILDGEIGLPEFQRSFSWSFEQGMKLMMRLLNGDFVPPVVIAYLVWGNGANKIRNDVLDGQQRLSTIALFYLGWWPKDFKEVESILDSDEGNESKDDEGGHVKSIEWTFNELRIMYQKTGSSMEKMQQALKSDGRYEKISAKIGNDEELQKIFNEFGDIANRFEENYLGFSFIKPASIDMLEAKQSYSRIFRSINMSGTPLTDAESRAALVWLKPDRSKFLAPEFARTILVNNRHIDWVRLLALTSEAAQIYSSESNYNFDEPFRVAVGQSKKMENYYEDFVLAMTGDPYDKRFTPYTKLLKARMAELENCLRSLLKQGIFTFKFNNIIVSDICLMGPAFWIVYMGKKIEVNKDRFMPALESCISNESSEKALQHPNQLAFLRPRLNASILLYSGCVK